ncbi:unnamed protein product, partial [Adineta steineri]
MNKSPILLGSLISKISPNLIRCVSSSNTSTNAKKVAVLGASGGIGQPLSLLLKLSPLISELSLYDIQ